MEKYKEDFYQSQGKNTFFKKSQKMDCAKQISETFPLAEMIQQTISIIPGTNKIIFNYQLFKLYANDGNYADIIQGVVKLYDIVLQTYSTFEAHIILDTFTISAAERYKLAIKIFCEKCMNSTTKYSQYLSCMYIYYTPSMIESISTLLSPFIDPLVKDRIVMYSKQESDNLLQALYASAVQI